MSGDLRLVYTIFYGDASLFYVYVSAFICITASMPHYDIKLDNNKNKKWYASGWTFT